MDERIYKELDKLKTAMKEDERFLRLSMLETRLEEDEEVIELSAKLKSKEEAYSFSLSVFDKGSEEARKAQKELYEAKKELDSLPLVKEYNKAYTEVRDLYMRIDDILFSPFRHKILKIGSYD